MSSTHYAATPPAAEQDTADYVDGRIRHALRRRAQGKIREHVDEIEREQALERMVLAKLVLWSLAAAALIAFAVYAYYR